MLRFITSLIVAVGLWFPMEAQLDFGRLLQGGAKAFQAITLSDDQIIEYVHDYITQTDAENTVADASSPYSKRLATLTSGLTQVEGIPLNFKVYIKNDVNAFACADGSVRVYSGLMDVMTNDELLGVIGHEMGHVAHKDTKKAFKQALLNAALKDGLASTSTKIAALTDSQLGALTDALAQAKYSQKQENNADDYGYDFLKKNGKNPAAMLWSFQKLKQLEDASGSQNTSKVSQLFSTHPQLSKRIDRMAKKASKDGYSTVQPTSATNTNSSTTSKTLTTKTSSPKTATKKSSKK